MSDTEEIIMRLHFCSEKCRKEYRKRNGVEDD